MAAIRAIDASSIHHIQAGQVIVDLQSVVKELIENSLDAGARTIDIRFRNHGLDLIEVQDDGCGIPQDDYSAIGLKHYTSKLNDFNDLSNLDTFGFRGEALSSLCAVSTLRLTTKRRDDVVAKMLIFEQSGALKSVSTVAAQRGTTVTVSEIFARLPVRRKDLEKNIRREFNKAVNLLYAYAAIQVGVRLSVSHQSCTGRKTSIFMTKGCEALQDNVRDLFGVKLTRTLLELDMRLAFPAKNVRQNVDQGPNNNTKISGYISRPYTGDGQPSHERQFLFLNSRPCLLPQISRAFNDTYKSFNPTQTPFLIANLEISTNYFDVNVSPDKRSIFLHDEHILVNQIKDSLALLYDKADHTMPRLVPESGNNALARYNAHQTHSAQSHRDTKYESHIRPIQSPADDNERRAHFGVLADVPHEKSVGVIGSVVSNQSVSKIKSNIVKAKSESLFAKIQGRPDKTGQNAKSLHSEIMSGTFSNVADHIQLVQKDLGYEQDQDCSNENACSNMAQVDTGMDITVALDNNADVVSRGSRRLGIDKGIMYNVNVENGEIPKITRSRYCKNSPKQQGFIPTRAHQLDVTPLVLRPANMHGLAGIDRIQMLGSKCGKRVESQTLDTTSKSFQSEISPAQAERGLSLVVHKSDFERMRIVGQFNLGFILAAKWDFSLQACDQLFVVDQHAADEKWNFERLQANATIDSQRLAIPRSLELTAMEIEIIRHNIPALAVNGFQVRFANVLLEQHRDAMGSALGKERCELVSLPMSGNTTFGPADLEELLHLLSNLPTGSEEIPRPKKVQRLLAMRACRSSIMIGTALSLTQMQTIVRHLGSMDKPWNCPHGRPTIRHLASLSTWQAWRKDDIGGSNAFTTWNLTTRAKQSRAGK